MKVVVTGGGTSAPIDDVRVITNVSTGRTAAAIAEACLDRGDEVWYVHSPLAFTPILRFARYDLDADPDVERARLDGLRTRWLDQRSRLHLRPLKVGTVSEYAATLQDVLTAQPIDVVYLPMAVSDYEPEPRTGKIRSTHDDLAIPLRPTPKVIRSVRDWAPSAYLVGFKLLSGAPTERLLQLAREACQANRADLTAANDLQDVRAGRHTLHLVRPDHPVETLPPGLDLADRLVDLVRAWRAETARRGNEDPAPRSI